MWRKLFDPSHMLHPTKRNPASQIHAWLDLCQLATHQQYKHADEVLERGEFIVSLRWLAERWKWHHLKVRRFLGVIEEWQNIETVRETPRGTVYRIVKYDTYAVAENGQRNTERNKSETGVKQEQEQEEQKKKENREKKVRFRDGWVPTEKHSEMAAELGRDVEFEARAFEDYHVSKGSTFIDWDRAFNNWLRKASEFGRSKPRTTARDRSRIAALGY